MALTNAQYDSIMRNYEKTQSRNTYLLDKRFKEIEEKLPKYQEISRSISSLCLERGKRLLNGDVHATASLHDEISALSHEKKTLLRDAGYPDDYLEPIYDCPLCKDTGFIDGRKCSCFKQAVINLLYQQSNIKEMLKEENFSKLSMEYYIGEDLQRFSHAVEGSKKFIEDFHLDYHNLFFYGTVGTGKSFLSNCIAKELMDKGYSVIYFSSSRLFDTLSKMTFEYQSKEELNRIYDDLYNCDLLIIDDLGTELTNSFVASSLFSCLNERQLRKNPTIISTNLSLEELSKRYSERIFSRITSYFQLYKLSGQDIRMHKKRVANRK
ncbi:MAG: ATP-binding protein [Roseburia sp.]|nr:ATP-binding protein [Roseburia sp.]MCM1279957.1 ATP-binding protein [Robinsoniella sp.]